MKKSFKGSIVIGDPSYFVKSDDDWEKCNFGEDLKSLGFTDYLYIDFPDDPQIVKNAEDSEVLGGICQDSGVIVVVYKNELEKYNPDYEKDFYDENNRTIIDNFDGEILVEKVSVSVDGYEDEDTIISSIGNIIFTSGYEE